MYYIKIYFIWIGPRADPLLYLITTLQSYITTQNKIYYNKEKGECINKSPDNEYCEEVLK